MVLELLEGGQLDQKLKQNEKFEIADLQKIMRDILEGLSYMHERNIIHRDIKPPNVIFKHKDHLDCSIADFGLSTRSDVGKFLFVRCGTPGFVAPEVINMKDPNAKYSKKCDIFSLGILFHLL